MGKHETRKNESSGVSDIPFRPKYFFPVLMSSNLSGFVPKRTVGAIVMTPGNDPGFRKIVPRTLFVPWTLSDVSYLIQCTPLSSKRQRVPFVFSSFFPSLSAVCVSASAVDVGVALPTFVSLSLAVWGNTLPCLFSSSRPLLPCLGASVRPCPVPSALNFVCTDVTFDPLQLSHLHFILKILYVLAYTFSTQCL